ncbi:uncharacterized protein STEHIDRAFT_102234 [Stereum hirsutum FP-91666 SS1]|uniref:uncharacterized protein n=1 Tax=Stereum hirsutum (strain FP-91666) TaxID=721885 RepID=UPI00044495DF|nr:uncharacterized protein STEHIDRAFT_102234 [Stereum hirsutum FP-91666 SS1]EIM82825.1 hypothetical protein STEHIDRAFT_102234 [Stereum hirsutum FP-91666 SS1]
MSFLQKPFGAVGNTVNAAGQGVSSGLSSATNAFNPTKEQLNTQPDPSKPDPALTTPKTGLDSQPQQPPESSGGGGFGGVLGGIGGGINSAVTTGVGSLGDITSAGFNIGKNVAKTGVNVTSNVAVGTLDLAGTAVGGVVNLAAETSGKVFEPVASGLKAIDGLQGLGEGLEYVNGLPVKAVREVGGWTVKAMNMSGKTPTFFDTDGDGIVHLEDTVRGLIVLGLDEKNARYAAYALHAVFSYPTSESWIPARDMTVPIRINKMKDTRWGKNWGSYERIDWCSDMDVNQFFETNENATRSEQWQETFKKGRQYWGVLLLIFEWGTTWPFWMPEGVPVDQIPFKDDIGKVVKTLVLPTIFANYQKAREADQKKPEAPPSENAPTDAKEA